MQILQLIGWNAIFQPIFYQNQGILERKCEKIIRLP